MTRSTSPAWKTRPSPYPGDRSLDDRPKNFGTTEWYRQFLKTPLVPMPPRPDGVGPTGGQTREQMEWMDEVSWREDLATAFSYVFDTPFRLKHLRKYFRWEDTDGGIVGFFSGAAYVRWYVGLNPDLFAKKNYERPHPFVHSYGGCPFLRAERDAKEQWKRGELTDAEFKERLDDLRDGMKGELLFEVR